MNMNNELSYDKINGDVYFIEESHKYGNVKYPNIEYLSVTTAIGKYHEKFDDDFWSSYKAIEKIFGIKTFKNSGIRKTLLNTKKWKDDYLDLVDIDKNLFFDIKRGILLEYETNRRESCEIGTAYHLKRELEFYNKPTIKIPNLIGDDTEFQCEKHNWDLSRENAILPEYLVYYHSDDGLLNIAGQVDLLIKKGNEISIYDYKSNKNGIDKKAYFNKSTNRTKRMFYPLTHIDDTTYNHYELQLSFYAWMLKKVNPNFEIKQLVLLHNPRGEGEETRFDLVYREKDIESLVHDLWKQKYLDKQKNVIMM